MLSKARWVIEVVFTVVGLLLGTDATSAAVIYDNWNPNNTANPISGFSVSYFVPQDLAVPFLVTGGPYRFQSADLALRVFSWSNGNRVEVQLREDSGGMPGAVIESIPVTVPLLFPGHGTVTATSITRPELSNGASYWIAAVSQADFDGAWQSPAVISQIGIAASNTHGAGWSPKNGLEQGALRVRGELQTVPELPSGCLWLAVAIIVFGARRARTSTAKDK